MPNESEALHLRKLGARILSEANDLKRTTEALAAELDYPFSQIEAVIAGDAGLEAAHAVLQSMARVYPVSIADLWVEYDDTDHGVRIVTAAESAASRRIFDRRDRDGGSTRYYEYRDTAMSRTAPFKPEWIEEPPEWMSPVEHDRYCRLLSIQKECGIPLAELALRFILGNRDVSVTIPGAANIEQLEANVACSTKGPLPVDLQAEIEALGILHEDPRRYV